MKALCVGHATYDITLPTNEFPVENKKMRIKKQVACGGGPACNASYLLAKWGIDTTFAGIVGDDYYGNNIISELEKVGVNTKYVEKNKDIQTDSSYIIANLSNGSRTIITAKEQTIAKLSKNIDLKADILLVDGEHYLSAKEAIDNNPNAISILDAGRVNDEVCTLGKMVTYLICSKDFAEEFTNTKIDISNFETLVTAYETLKINFKTNIIITLDKDGSFTKIDDYEIIPSLREEVLDSTGAGDIFHGAFAYFISNGYSLKKTIELSSITSAISVTRMGGRYSIPELSEVLEKEQNCDII